LPTNTPSLPVSRYKLRFAAENLFSFSGFSGSAWRGVFGHALKKTVCITRNEICRQCMLYRSCVYPYIFETPAPPHSLKLRNYDEVPRPFVLSVPWGRTNPARTFETGLTLFGRGNHYLAYIIHSLRRAASAGVAHSPPLTLEAVLQSESDAVDVSIWAEDRLDPRAAFFPAVPPPPRALRIDLLTPLRMRLKDRYVTPEQFQFGDLFRSLLSRISSLQYFHTDNPLVTDFAGLAAAAGDAVFASKTVTWCDWTRSSSRQRQEMQMGGLMGSVTVSCDSARWPEMWPYLWLGQWTHAGKGTSMGLGRYTIGIDQP
jgi:hypothetical protein